MTSSHRAVFPVLGVLLLLPLALAPGVAAEPSATEDKLSDTLLRGGFSFDLELLSPQVQATTDSIIGPYFFFLLTNTGTQTDTYHMEVSVAEPGWFGQCCIGQLCFPDSVDITLNPAESESVGVKIDPLFNNGSTTADYLVESLGDPSQTALTTVTLYAGTGAVGVGSFEGELPFTLSQNYPNPVRTNTSIDFALPFRADVALGIYDVAGKKIRTLSRGSLPAGPHTITWDRRDRTGAVLPSGVYYLRLETPDGVLTRRMTVLH